MVVDKSGTETQNDLWRRLNHRLHRISPEKNSFSQTSLILPIDREVKAWRKANQKMGWGIDEKEFEDLPEPPAITQSESEQGYMGTVLFYGFGDDGSGNSDSVLSGKVAWEYAKKTGGEKRGSVNISTLIDPTIFGSGPGHQPDPEDSILENLGWEIDTPHPRYRSSESVLGKRLDWVLKEFNS